MNHGHRRGQFQPEHRASEQGRYGRDRQRSDESRFGSDPMNRGGHGVEGGGNPRHAPEFYAEDDFGGQSGRFQEGREGQERDVYSGGYSGQEGSERHDGYERDPANLSGSRYRSGRGGYGPEPGAGERYGGATRGGDLGGSSPSSGRGMFGQEMGRSDQGRALGERSGTELGFNDSWRSMDRPRYAEARTRRAPKGYTRSDERIKEDVCERLMDCGDVELGEVSVEVQNGKVILDGTVPERRMKHTIEDVACSCTGVRDVENKVRIGDSATRDDDAAASRLSAASRGASTKTRQ